MWNNIDNSEYDMLFIEAKKTIFWFESFADDVARVSII